MKRWFTITNKAAAEATEVAIYGEIGTGWDGSSGVDAKAFAEEWNAIPRGQKIDLRIHSPGGSVFDGLLIYNLVAMRRADVTAHIDGVALSAASFIAMAASRVVMPKTARMMIHDAQGFAIGDSQNMQEMADLLDRESDRIADIYAARTGKDRAAMRALMQATTWMDGTEAKAMGFADEVTSLDAHNCTYDLSNFRRVPEELKPNAPNPANIGAEIPHKNMSNIIDPLVANQATVPPVAVAPVATVTATATPSPANVISLDQFNALTNQLNAEKEKRITAEFDRIVQANPSIDRAVWLPRALKDETIMASLAQLPGRIVDPSRPSVSNLGNPVIENYRKMKPGAARNAYRVENHEFLQNNAAAIIGGQEYANIRNANTLAAALTPDYLADGLIVIARNKLAPLAAFSRDFGVDAMKPKSTVQVARATVGATGQTDATNFETGDTTLAASAVTVSQKTVSFHLTNDQLNKGHQISNLAQINADQFADMISDVWTPLLVVANYGTPGAGTGVIGASTAFDSADLPGIFGLAKNFRRRNLILDGSYLAYLFPGVTTVSAGVAGINQPSQGSAFGPMFGFDGFYMQNRWTTSVANTVGFVCGPDTIAVASGLPISTATPSGEFMSQQVVNLDVASSNDTSLGLSVQINMWYSRSSRTIWASYDVMFGAGLGDASTTLTAGQGRILISA